MTTAKAKTALSINLRETLQRAAAAVLGRRYTDTAAAQTLGDLAQARIDEIEGVVGSTRMSQVDEITQLNTQLTAAITTIKSAPDSAFALEAEEQSRTKTNTAE